MACGVGQCPRPIQHRRPRGEMEGCPMPHILVNTRSPDLVPRFLPLVAGAALGTWGIRRGGWAGVAGALIGIGLLARGMTGHGPLVAPLASGRPKRRTATVPGALQTGARDNDD